MKPSVAEQLRGIRRVLDQVVAPELGDAYAANQLREVGQALELLAARWHRVTPLMMQENDELQALLGDAAPALAPRADEARQQPGLAELAAHIEAALANTVAGT